MSADLIHLGIDCGVALACVVVVTFILNRMGFHAWFWLASRQKSRIEDSSAKRYWSAHE